MKLDIISQLMILERYAITCLFFPYYAAKIDILCRSYASYVGFQEGGRRKDHDPPLPFHSPISYVSYVRMAKDADFICVGYCERGT